MDKDMDSLKRFNNVVVVAQAEGPKENSDLQAGVVVRLVNVKLSSSFNIVQ
jgi:hypothetical protein